MNRFRPAILLFFLLCGLPTLSAMAGYDPGEQFNRLREYYQQRLLAGDEPRENWQRASKALQRLQRENPQHEVAPLSLYLLGNLHHRLHRRDDNPLDLAAAITFFEDMQATYPRHPLADDALLYLARIFRHDRDEPERAGRFLARLVALYPDSEPAAEARKQLPELRAQLGSRLPRTAAPRAKAGESPAMVKPLRHWSSPDYTRVVIETSTPLTFRSQMLPNGGASHRLRLDLAGARLGPKLEEGKTMINDGLLKSLRLSQYTPDAVRLELETRAAIDDYKIFSLENPARVVIDLQGQPPPPLQVVQPIPRPPGAGRSPSNGASEARRPLSLARQLGLGVHRVVIDPGHGGRDPGAVSASGLQEKEVTLRVAKLLAEALRQQGSEVLLTRRRDLYLPLEERTAIANSRGADLFISIHANAAANHQARGVETYVLDMIASDDQAMRLAALENASSTRNFSELQSIVEELLNQTKLQESIQLAEAVQTTTVDSLRQRYGNDIQDRGVRRAPFVVLLGARMPALLVEMGFLSNPEEEKRLADDEYLNQLAHSIAAGIGRYANSLDLATAR
ncbi:MAG: N-acetylmuramoyl-L-alanine amidase [Desulfurivibrio sp.]|nr:N-acetylmuramoyl-L-alanine amidase [Desulfurivibrio sp.]